MRIGLNATCFNGRPSGANQRFAGIYGALIRSCPDLDFIVYEPADWPVGSQFEGAANVTVRRTPLPSAGRIRRTAVGLAYWPAAIARDRLDLFEHFHLPLVRAAHCPTVLTVHDARPVLPEVPLAKRMVFGRILRSALRRADHVITVSETMKKEIFAIEPSASVTSIYNGIDAAPFDSPSSEAVRSLHARLDLPRDYLLAIGHLEKRKNYPRLIEAIAALRDQGRPVSLVIVGNDGGEGGRIAGLIRRSGLEDNVRILSGVSQEELTALYAQCALVVFPSYYEGFGIPILEAMAAHRPILLSDIPVFRELTQNQGAYFPPHDSRALAQEIGDLLSNEERRRVLVDYGDSRVPAFAFAKLAAEVELVYRRLLTRA